MHLDQLKVFSAVLPRINCPPASAPFTLEGHTYALDGSMLVRWPHEVDGAKPLFTGDPEADASRARTAEGCKSLLAPLAALAAASAELTPLSSLALEPVITRSDFRDGGEVGESDDPVFTWMRFEKFVSLMTLVKIGQRTFDARRLLMIRQTLPDVRYYAQPEATFDQALRFVFGEGGEGILMPVRGDNAVKHWNGAEYLRGT